MGKRPTQQDRYVALCRLIDLEGLTVTVQDLDAIDGTAILDVKPSIAEFGPAGSSTSRPGRTSSWRLLERNQCARANGLRERPRSQHPKRTGRGVELARSGKPICYSLPDTAAHLGRSLLPPSSDACLLQLARPRRVARVPSAPGACVGANAAHNLLIRSPTILAHERPQELPIGGYGCLPRLFVYERGHLSHTERAARTAALAARCGAPRTTLHASAPPDPGAMASRRYAPPRATAE